MKKLLFYSLFALTLLAVPSCGDDDEDEPTTTPSGNETNTIAVSGLTLDKEAVTLEEGTTLTLTATVTPDNATDKTVTWTSSDAAVATVSDGKVTAVKEGEATITAKAGDKTAECKVSVKPITFTVTFDTDGGSEVSAQTVEKGKKATWPQAPTKENFVFQCWYLGDNKYDFSVAVTADIILKARYKYADAFSVSETKQVYFSFGNLQYHCKNKEWRFAPNQYDRIGDANANISDDYDGYIDLFGWGIGDNPTFASINNDDYTTFADWGAKIDDGNVWQILTRDEWDFLIRLREDAWEKYGVAEVAGVQGLILLPDGWSLPAGLSFNSGAASDEGEEYFKTMNNYSAEEWRKMESSGAVFLPAAGRREGTSVYEVCSLGWYWSSQAYETDYELCHWFDSDNAFGEVASWRYQGHSVRLVREVK